MADASELSVLPARRGKAVPAPVSKPGDHVVLRAELDCVVALPACPQDMVPINGAAMTPTEAHYHVLG
jgi:uncharacterized protein YcgI (DUF1989 family)